MGGDGMGVARALLTAVTAVVVLGCAYLLHRHGVGSILDGSAGL